MKWADNLDIYEYENKLCEAVAHDHKIYKIITKFVKSSHDCVVIGICLILIRLINDKSMQYQSSDISIKLPDDFPEELRKEVVKSIESELGFVHGGSWKSEIERQKALDHELYIFSRGNDQILIKSKIV